MMIIFQFSMQDGEESAGLSLTIVHMILKIFPFIKNQDLLHFIIRKAAHMSEYALLSLTFVYGFYKSNFVISKVCLYSLLCTFLYACSDELHQLFVSGRAGQFTDVLIDTTGGVIMIVCLFILYRKKLNNKKKI